MNSSSKNCGKVYSKLRAVCFISLFLKRTVLDATRVNPDQTPSSAASDMGLQCMPMSLLWVINGLFVGLRTKHPTRNALE